MGVLTNTARVARSTPRRVGPYEGARDYTPDMRRALLVFMIVILPFQWVWAAAASTYTHEAAGSVSQFSQHVHDHVHEHVAEQASAAADTEKASFAADHSHCGGAHLWADMACDDASLPPNIGWSRGRIGTSAPAFESHVPAGPERPDRGATP
jgi:hypothetical protein